MDAVALTARLPLTRGRRRASTASCGLAFDETGGPLVAVCGLVGGAGTSTLALCLASQAARESAVPIMLSEAAAHGAGFAVTAGSATQHSLTALARLIADGQAPEAAFTELAPGLRLIAAAPSRATSAEPDALRALLDQARAAHGLVVVDCGADWATTAPILEHSTHILWTLPATRTGTARASALFAGHALPTPGRAREALVVIASRPRPEASVRALRRLASERCERLVLIPHSHDLARGDLTADERMRHALTGLATTLRRVA